MAASLFLGLNPFQWLALIVSATTLLVMVDAFVGHYRHNFSYRLQYGPLVAGPLLAASVLLTAALPGVLWLHYAACASGWLAVASGLIGFGYHAYYGIVKKPGGMRWLLHHLMYGAPLLFPLALSAMGFLAIIISAGLAGERGVFGIEIPTMLLIFVVLVLIGSVLQAGLLHYRGAFNTPAMYAPLTVPVVTALAGVWIAVAPSDFGRIIFGGLLWLTLIIGFIGFGMHLRGLDRQMGGLYVAVFNLMQGPPQGAPGIFAALAGIGLVTIYLM
jgi:hypothetical protein